MRQLLIILTLMTFIISCSNQDGVKIYYGEKFEEKNPITTEQLIESIQQNETTELIQVSGTIEKSCSHSGCWLTLDNPADEKIFVTYKDNAFTTAKRIDGKKITLLGHGSHNEEKNQYEFVAEGVILN